MLVVPERDRRHCWRRDDFSKAGITSSVIASPPIGRGDGWRAGTNTKDELALFDVVYEDGSQPSNRREPAELLGGLDGDGPARGYIVEQDCEIAEKSGRPLLAIKSTSRTGTKKK
jgi:hypothetical protein